MKYLLCTLPFVSATVLAHTGHDHAHWSAPLWHALWLAPIAVSIIATAYFVYKEVSK